MLETVAAAVGLNLDQMIQDAVPMRCKRRVIRRRGKKFVVRPVIGWAMVRWHKEAP